MKKLLTTTALAAALIVSAWTGEAYATPITGTLSINGSDTFTATSITFSNPANIGGGSLSFSELTTCTGCVTMSNFNSGSTNFLVYTGAHNGDTTTLTLSSATFTETPNGLGGFNLDILGNGVATLTNFDPTPGVWELTTQSASGQATFTFSATTLATAVPEPASLAIFGASLLGFGLIRRRRNRA